MTCACERETAGKVTYSEHLSHPDKRLFVRSIEHGASACEDKFLRWGGLLAAVPDDPNEVTR